MVNQRILNQFQKKQFNNRWKRNNQKIKDFYLYVQCHGDQDEIKILEDILGKDDFRIKFTAEGFSFKKLDYDTFEYRDINGVELSELVSRFTDAVVDKVD